jgi:diguanylate cyclase (GGDEF)-like protein
MLLSIALGPFETAMREIVAFLHARQIEVFLFDDDKFLATELRTDGKSFVYNKEDERPPLPEAVSEVKIREIQETALEVPLRVDGELIGHYRVTHGGAEACDTAAWQRDVEWVTPVVARLLESNRNRIQSRKVYIDDLTQLYNKRKLNEQMGKLFKQFKRGEKKLHIGMLDIDKFKVLNDTYGHPVGDAVLRQTAAIIKEEVPYAYRYGGEEFAAVFSGQDREQAMGLMERLRRRIEETVYTINGQEYRITISGGVAEFETHMNSIMDAIDRADQALYASKEDGRNRITYFADVKDRLSADATKLRQEILQLREQVRHLSEQVGREKQRGKPRSAEKE